MPTISVVTPVYDGGHAYLRQTYESLRAQKMPDGWTWQWVVQEDGLTGRPFESLPDDPRISLGVGRVGRAAMARTVAMSRAEGVITRTLDADDLLTEGALYRDIETLTARPRIGWCVSAVLDLMPDGSLVPGPCDPPSGPLERGILAAGYSAGNLQVMGTTLAAYTELIHALGGWQALPATEDVALLLACEAVSDGWMIGEVSAYYRKHPIQSTADAMFHNSEEQAARRAVVLSRVEALSRSGWRWSPEKLASETALRVD